MNAGTHALYHCTAAAAILRLSQSMHEAPQQLHLCLNSCVLMSDTHAIVKANPQPVPAMGLTSDDCGMIPIPRGFSALEFSGSAGRTADCCACFSPCEP